MAVVIRFQRFGRPQKPFYRLVAIDKRSKRNGKTLDILGHYHAGAESKIHVQEDRLAFWRQRGAKASDSARTLLMRAGFWSKTSSMSKGA